MLVPLRSAFILAALIVVPARAAEPRNRRTM